jgi:hypothetical protein
MIDHSDVDNMCLCVNKLSKDGSAMQGASKMIAALQVF